MDPPSASPAPPARLCSRHGLGAGPDGRCVLCHRGEAERDTSDGAKRLVAVALLGVSVLGVALVWRGVKGTVATEREPVRGDGTALAPPPEPEEPAPGRTPEAQKARRDIETKLEENRAIEEEMRKVKVRMFVVKKCSLCDLARRWLIEKGVSFTEIDVGEDTAALDAMHRLTPSNDVPVFDVEGEVLVGFGPTNVAAAVRRAADRHLH